MLPVSGEPGVVWGEFGVWAVWLAFPIVLSMVVGECYRLRLHGELIEARRLARRMYLELDEARYELQELQETLDRAGGGPPTEELPPVRPDSSGGRHRLCE